MAPARLHLPSRPWLLLIVGPLLVAAACLLGLRLYHGEQSGRDGFFYSASPVTAPDRIDIVAVVQKVDAVAGDIIIRTIAVPQGNLSAGPDSLVPAQELVVESTSLAKGVVTFPAGQRIASQDLTMSMEQGQISDYPFDDYQTTVAFAATEGGKDVPVNVTLQDSDPFFNSRASDVASDGLTGFKVDVSRTQATLVLAWFMMIAMWVLALGVFAAAWLLGNKRRGMVWPALGWMAATMFALSGFRNTAPGSPPFGCLLDYTAFLWAEVITAFSLAYVVVRGMRVEWTAEK